MLTRRRLTPEMMDDPSADPAELDASLGFLRTVNRRLGGVGASLRMLRRWSRQWPRDETIRIIDLGTGTADIPLAIADWAAARGLRIHITGVDMHETTLAIARQRLGDHPAIELVECDALRLMERFEPGSFDYAHASLFLHHLPDMEVLTVLRIMDRLARRGMIWNDLKRTPIALFAVRGLALAGRLPGLRVPLMARHDAVVSVEAGFTRAEAVDLASRAGWFEPGSRSRGSNRGGFRYRSHLCYRFTLAREKRG